MIVRINAYNNERRQVYWLDVHQATLFVGILDSAGNLVMEAILETKAETILQFLHGLRGSLHVTFEEGTCAAWLHDLLKPHVTQVVVGDRAVTGNPGTGIELPGRATRQVLTSPAQLNHRTVID